jgi:AcrR family transcriptional regulator
MASSRQVRSPQAPATSLRERKKARTRAAIQREALRLFQQQGYDATTVEQVAAAAEVAASTVFRYFATKEDLVLADEYDPVFLQHLRDQPPNLSALATFRAALRITLDEMPAAEIAETRDRIKLMLTVPVLRGTFLDTFAASTRAVADVMAERTGRSPDDPAIRTFTGIVFGIGLEVMLRWADDPHLDLPTTLDTSLALIEAGLPL